MWTAGYKLDIAIINSRRESGDPKKTGRNGAWRKIPDEGTLWLRTDSDTTTHPVNWPSCSTCCTMDDIMSATNRISNRSCRVSVRKSSTHNPRYHYTLRRQTKVTPNFNNYLLFYLFMYSCLFGLCYRLSYSLTLVFYLNFSL